MGPLWGVVVLGMLLTLLVVWIVRLRGRPDNRFIVVTGVLIGLGVVALALLVQLPR